MITQISTTVASVPRIYSLFEYGRTSNTKIYSDELRNACAPACNWCAFSRAVVVFDYSLWFWM